MMKLLFLGAVVCCAVFSVQAQALSYSSKYEQCMRQSGTQSDAILSCQRHELKVQNKRVKKLYRKTFKLASETDQPLIERMQTQWLQQRELACNIKDKKIKEYSMSNANCAVQMTVAQADMLEVRMNNAVIK